MSETWGRLHVQEGSQTVSQQQGWTERSSRDKVRGIELFALRKQPSHPLHTCLISAHVLLEGLLIPRSTLLAFPMMDLDIQALRKAYLIFLKSLDRYP